jgi:DNA-binding MarR family transcriptional regulator
MELEKEIHQKTFRSKAHKAAVNIIYTFNWMNTFHSAFLKRFGLTGQQFNVLRILRGQHPKLVTIKLIRERMLDKMSDASRIVEKLRVKGLLDRDIDQDDRRACQVSITKKGLDLLSEIEKEEMKLDEPFQTLSGDELQQLNVLLDKLRG